MNNALKTLYDNVCNLYPSLRVPELLDQGEGFEWFYLEEGCSIGDGIAAILICDHWENNIPPMYFIWKWEELPERGWSIGTNELGSLYEGKTRLDVLGKFWLSYSGFLS